jgi:4-aminobutyrate aminotransferase-like enzyme/Ser/Thr protein kinase RdoA (MazF antagonist)
VSTEHGLARLLTWVEGSPYAAYDAADRDAAAIGRAVADVLSALADFEPRATPGRGLWDLANAPASISGGLPAIGDPYRRGVVERVVAAHRDEIGPLWDALVAQQIHNDINDLNLLMDASGSVTGLVDFGDTVYSARVCEVAVAAAYLMLDQDDPVTIASRLIAEVKKRIDLEPAEAAVLLPMIRSRLALSVSISATRAGSANPHHLVSEESAWDLLETLDAADGATIRAELAAAAGHPVPDPQSRRGSLLGRRAETLLPSLSLHYEEPLLIVRGSGTHLFDERARRYLDCVNNVAHVGHANPAVAAAAAAQERTLNTNTRFLHPAVVEYAERLAATLPDPLRVVTFVNSGSEANELAVRMARAHTGAHDMAVLASGYHGNTVTTVDLSAYKFDGPGGSGKPPWVHVLPLPDPYRTPYSGPGAGAAYREASRAVLSATNRPLAGLIAESIIGCGGQIVPEPGVLAAAYDVTRAAGGVCIADEVQVGFGRVGTAFWGFELHGVMPDIVTLGKPIGNGHPLGAVVTTREIAESFGSQMEYFNTFGGNPVSAAVGMAVLDELARLDLQENALDVGAYVQEELLSLADAHRTIGDVRGAGLFIGVELVADRKTRTPAPAIAGRVIEEARREGVLLSIDGPHHNVVKIKPPLVFSHSDADWMIRALDTALGRAHASR